MENITVIAIIQSMIYALVMEDMYSMFFPTKKLSKVKYLLLWGGYFLAHLFFIKPSNSPLIKMVGNFGAFFLILIVAYRERIKMKLMITLLVMFLCSAVEVIFYMSVMAINDSIDLNEPIYGILTNIMIWGIAHLIFCIAHGKIHQTSKKTYLGMLGIVILINGVLGLFITQISIHTDNGVVRGLTLGLGVVLLIIDIIGFKLYSVMLEKSYIKNENEKYLLQLRLNEQQIIERQASIKEMKRTRHDIKQHLLYVKELVNYDPLKAREYIDELVNVVKKNEQDVFSSNNIVIDALLNHKYILAKQKGIEMFVQLSVPSEMEGKSADICVILGNLLDNAIEAVEKLETNKKIDVLIKYTQKKIYFQIKNPYAGSVIQDAAGNYLTTKEEKKNHGIGLESVRRCVDKNNGIMEISSKNNIFDVQIII